MPALCVGRAARGNRARRRRRILAAACGHGAVPARRAAEGGRVELARAENYWDGDKPYVDGLTIEYSENGGKLSERLRAGELAFLRDGSASRVASLAQDPEWKSCIVLAQQLHTQMLVLDAGQPPFDDVRVRRAVAHAIDKRRLVEEVYGEMAIPAAGPIPPGLIGHDAEYQGLQYDPLMSRRLRQAAGYRSGIKLDLWRSFSEQSTSERAGRLLCEQLAEVGIECEIHLADAADLMSARSKVARRWPS